MRMRPDEASGYPGRTYRFYNGDPVFEFGFGSSYSAFSYRFKPLSENPLFLNKSTFSVQSTEKPGSISYDISEMRTEECGKLKFSASIRVKNHGPLEGKHSILLFLKRKMMIRGRPVKQLIGFERISLKAEEKSYVEFVALPIAEFLEEFLHDIRGESSCHLVPTRIHKVPMTPTEDEG
ncbi:putative beta-D-xylosidase 7 [Apostasia shenzhenica]|uniref:Putative beta-D-xylosidase 7 n=1 Tax=Apostasia shenzhenica TaxID=1088818 RepID=A0A2I0AY70_9ASPA|nr:putative beta-D-xylosidase 7 [Apostasia shenzhenica]